MPGRDLTRERSTMISDSRRALGIGPACRRLDLLIANILGP
jgi:hypothetical protein